MEDCLDQILSGTFPDPDGGSAIGMPARIEIAESLAGREAELVGGLGSLLVVSDIDTHAAMGARVVRALSGTVESVVLPSGPKADLDTVERLRPLVRAADTVVVVGSGTLNDLCKYAAFLEDRPHVVFATAPSMNGYTSVNAAITVRGHKRSLAARAPVAAFTASRSRSAR